MSSVAAVEITADTAAFTIGWKSGFLALRRKQLADVTVFLNRRSKPPTPPPGSKYAWREREGADEVAEDFIREARVEGDEYILVWKAGVSRSRPGRRGMRTAGVAIGFFVDAARREP